MSAALVRQALEFVDPDESTAKGKGKKRESARGRLQGPSGQGEHNVLAKKPQKQTLKRRNLDAKKEEQIKAEEVVKKLLKLSEPTVDTKISGKIVERAVKGKALVDKIEINTEPEKSILFPEGDDEFDQFEEELFCS